MLSRRPPPESAFGNWSDGETLTLIDAWGHARHRRQPRGLRPKDWRAAASAVNAHRAAAGRRFNRTRVQCQTRIRTLKKRYKQELSRQPPSGWRHLPRLRAFLASPDEPPPGFPAWTTPASVKQEVKEEEEAGGSGLTWSWTVPRRPKTPPGFPAWTTPASVKQEVEEEEEEAGGSGLAWSWTVPRRPRNAAAGSTGFCPAAVVTKLAEVYERVEVQLARIGLEKVKMEMEMKML